MSFSRCFRRFQSTLPPRPPYHVPHSHPHPPAPSHNTSGTHLRPGKRSRAVTAAVAATATISAYTLGSFYPPDVVTLLAPRPAPPPPDPSLPSSLKYVAELDRTLNGLPVLAKMRSAPDADEWYETRPYLNYPEDKRVNSLTAGALRGPGKLALPPLVRAKKDESEAFVVVHVGRGLCGHDGIVHGGLLATIMDEVLGRQAIVNLPEKVAVTVNLNIDYKAPTKADQFLVVRTRLVELKGRKAVVEGTIEDLDGLLLVKAKAIFVQPKWAKMLNSDTVKLAMGEAQQVPILPNPSDPTAPLVHTVTEDDVRLPK